MMGINPFDQPGVEQGKKYTYGLMGRAGYEKDAEEVGEWFGKIAADTRYLRVVFLRDCCSGIKTEPRGRLQPRGSVYAS